MALEKPKTIRGTKRIFTDLQVERIIVLRTAGASYQTIANELKSNKVTVRDAYYRAMREHANDFDVGIYKAEMAFQLDLALKYAVQGMLNSQDDPQGLAQLLNSIVRVLERKAKLLGLDEPIKQNIKVATLDLNMIQEEAQRIRAELAQEGKVIEPLRVIDAK